MNEHTPKVETDSKILTALLLLPSNSVFYWRNLVQIPFLLRNALTLQRAGIEKLIIWMQDPAQSEGKRKFEQDPRLTLEVKWIDNGIGLQGTRVMVLDGSTLLGKSELAGAMKSVNSNQKDFSDFPFFPDSLQQLLESNEDNLIEVIRPDNSARIDNENDLIAAEERLLKSVGLNNDSLMDRLLTRFISRQLTRLFLLTGLTPNQITFLSLTIGLCAAWNFFQGTYNSNLTGAILLLVSAWVDCTDGEIARLKFMETEAGARFDIFCDNIVHFFVFFSIGMGLFFQTGDPQFKLFGALAVYGSLFSFIILGGVIVKKKQEDEQDETPSLSDQLANRDFTYFLFILACMGRLDIFIILTAIGSNLFAIYLIFQKWGPSLKK
ncbi:MAG: CDP-alcohol phosphatidyltransferase family protein [Nitrospinae bacterium]|nr:CDP-alcohol phosphatidyltransferase family protein [Nitrospinota bacterium]